MAKAGDFVRVEIEVGIRELDEYGYGGYELKNARKSIEVKCPRKDVLGIAWDKLIVSLVPVVMKELDKEEPDKEPDEA